MPLSGSGARWLTALMWFFTIFGSCALLLATTAVAGDTQMVPLPGKDVKAEVFKRLGLPDQSWCLKQCLDEVRCSGTRWGVIAGSTAGQCQLLTGALEVIKPHEIKTYDGQKIQVFASKKN